MANNNLIRKGTLFALLSMGGLTAASQTTISGGWKDFGVANNDTVITLDCKELVTDNRTKLFYADFRETFEVTASMSFSTLVTEQAFICKEGLNGEMFADLTIGYDPTTEQIFAEVKDEDGKLHRIVAGARVTKDAWFGVKVKAIHNPKAHKSVMTLTVTDVVGHNCFILRACALGTDCNGYSTGNRKVDVSNSKEAGFTKTEVYGVTGT